MKKSAKIALAILLVGMLTACGKDESPKAVTSSVNTESKEESIEPKTGEPMAQNTEYPEKTNDDKADKEAPTEAPDVETAKTDTMTAETLGKAYSDYIEKIASESDIPDELVFTTVDVDNDGTEELLYAESNVNAAGVYVCFYADGQIIPTGPFGCYGGMKYAPKEGKIISVMDNMDYMHYELIKIDESYETIVERIYAIEPDTDNECYKFFLDDEEVTENEYVDAFLVLQDMDVRSLDYDDMYMYAWCGSDTDPIEQRFAKMLTQDDPSRESHMIIPMVEKAKLIGTWEMYSSEVEGQVSYAEDGDVSGKITIHEDYTADLDYGRHKMSGMMMDFYNGSFNDYADNTDWYVVIEASEEDGTTIYMNVSEEDQLTVNTIGTGETLISVWDIYNRADESHK